MPACTGSTACSSPACRCATNARTSSSVSSVKTAMRAISGKSKREKLPQTLAAQPLVLRLVAAAVGRHDLVRPHARGLGRHHDALHLAAHAQLFDAHLVVL